ncbi:failed axon connections homolog [Convolutriloba macropyga]|uniref:failed axon connections homolog n=1 Tax=Convolutriloba macropyga TaxID=536237 RepID=UPI003F525860
MASNIVLHTFPPLKGCISASPFPIRVEAFLRWASIPYMTTLRNALHKRTKKTPWIEYKGEEIADSYYIIKRLEKDFKIDMDGHLTSEQKAISHALQRMLSEGTIFSGSAWSFLMSDSGRNTIKTFFRKKKLRGIAASYLAANQVKKQLWAQGIGRMPHEHILQTCSGDLDALSFYLSDKPYLMGDKMSSVDCISFAFLQVAYHTSENSRNESPLRDGIIGRLNLNEYRSRLQNELFPDWEEIAASKLSRRNWKPLDNGHNKI